jgi:cytochrome b561
MLMTTASAYRPPARVLHWLIAILLLATIPIGVTMTTEGLARSTQDAMFIFHKNVGVLIFLLMTARLIYRLAVPPPPLPASVPDWQRRIAGITHGLLYLLVFVMAISGYIRVVAGGFPLESLDALGVPRLAPRSDSLAETAKAVHSTTRWVLIPLILLHIGAGLFHGIVKRDGVLSRMLPSLSRGA